jgi:molybdopterin-guanine dinucleotide biosynthesis protein B
MDLPLIINIVGIGRESGKTSLVEFLTKRLRWRHYRVSTVKHISGAFNTVHKDTWRHLDAGALTVVAATPTELVSIKKIQNPSLEVTLEEIPKEVDIILVEGFKKSKYPKVIASQTLKDAETLMNDVKAVFAISGSVAENVHEKAIQGIPLLKPDELFTKVEEMVLQNTIKGLPGLNCGKCGYSSCEAFARTLLSRKNSIDQCIPFQETRIILKVNDEQVYLSPFPATIIKNVVLGMISDLKGVDKDSPQKISLQIKEE